VERHDDDLDFPASEHLRWPDGLAITVGLAVIALLATGWVDPTVLWH
jgi:hypothetical protein